MMRTAAACACVLCALVLVGACRQIVGIGDRSLSDAGGAPSCGLSFPDEGDCRGCMERECCSAAKACASSLACRSNEECALACGNDATCIGNCQITAPAGTVAQAPAFDACMASHCGAACAYSCGARGTSGVTEASVSCQACIAANACAAEQACADDVSCDSIVRCNANCATIDCAIACPGEYEAGAPLWTTFANQLAGSCAADCPPDWKCVGHVSWPIPKASAATLSVTVADIIDATPTVGADVKLCTKQDPACLQPLDDQTTDATGAVRLSYTAPTFGVGLDGYLQITSSATQPALFFWDFPLSEPNASLGGKVGTLKTASIPALFATIGVAPLAGHGHMGVVSFQCTHSTASGVEFKITPTDANTKIFYSAAGGGLNPGGPTDRSGLALIANIPAGVVTVEATSLTLGQVVSRVTILVRDGYLEQVYMLPTPQ